MKKIGLQPYLTTALVLGVILLVAAGSGGMLAILHREIVRGFERKIVVISTGLASFLDASQLERIQRGYQLVTVAMCGKQLYGVDVQGMLCQVRLDALGMSRPVLQLPAPPGDRPLLVQSAGNTLLYGPGQGDPRRWAIELAGCVIRPLPDEADAPLFVMPPGSGAARELRPEPGHPMARALSVVFIGGEYLALMPVEGHSQLILAFKEPAGDVSGIYWQDPDIALRSLVNIGDELWAISNRLLRLTPEGELVDFSTVPEFADNTTADYLEYQKPIVRIHKRCKVTYLYAFGLGNRMHGKPSMERDIYYIVDAVDAGISPSWLPIGYKENLPDANRKGILKARMDGRHFLGTIDYSLWGGLLVASTPVDRAGDTFECMAGCDIEMEILLAQTRRATFLMLSAGVLTLLTSLSIAYYSARLISAPILGLKRRILAWAAGDLHRPIVMAGPGALGALACSLEEFRRERLLEEERTLLERIEKMDLPLGVKEADCRWLAAYLGLAPQGAPASPSNARF